MRPYISILFLARERKTKAFSENNSLKTQLYSTLIDVILQQLKGTDHFGRVLA